MYFAGVMDHLSSAPKMELIIWGSTLGFWAVSSTQLKPLFARSKAGKVKVGSTGPRVLTKLLIVGQIIGTGIPLVVYWAATAYNKFHQPEWLVKHALPPPPDVFGIDGMVVGRAVGLLGTITGMVLGKAAIKALGDQFLGIGIREKPRLVDSGPFAYIRHPLYAANFIVAASFPLAFWSSIPLYALPITVCAHLLKVPIEEGIIADDPELGNEYKLYKTRVPYRIIPYIW